MKFWQRMGLLAVCLSCFQNCGEFKADPYAVYYTYSSRPDFFYDLKMVSVEIDNLGRERYEFDLALSFATNVDQTVNYQMAFSTLDRSGICTTQELSAVGDSKHRRFTCMMPTPDVLYVQLTILGPTGEQEVRQYRF